MMIKDFIIVLVQENTVTFFDFLMKLDNQGFGEAVRSLAQELECNLIILQKKMKKRKGVAKNSKTF